MPLHIIDRVNHRLVFFFSSRRRHTRFDCDWSSDVCSSDLQGQGNGHSRKFSLHQSLDEGDNPRRRLGRSEPYGQRTDQRAGSRRPWPSGCSRSEEHTPELQSQPNLVCRLLLEKKKHHPSPCSTLSSVMRPSWWWPCPTARLYPARRSL